MAAKAWNQLCYNTHKKLCKYFGLTSAGSVTARLEKRWDGKKEL